MIFFTDLDNTIIHSYKRAKKEDICVEKKLGENMSFMTQKSFSLFGEIQEKCTVIPVTTRSTEQYKRIKLPTNTKKPFYALACNGAILLKDNVVENDWLNASKELISDCIPFFAGYVELLCNSEFTDFDVKIVDGFFVFTKTKNVSETITLLKANVNMQLFTIYCIGNKVYIMPTVLSKGNAVKRFMAAMDKDVVVSAGDSPLDVSMLEVADIAIAAPKLNYNEKNALICEEDIKDFSDYVLEYIMSQI